MNLLVVIFPLINNCKNIGSQSPGGNPVHPALINNTNDSTFFAFVARTKKGSKLGTYLVLKLKLNMTSAAIVSLAAFWAQASSN